jgi:uncharacterized protein (TIGR02145 family)
MKIQQSKSGMFIIPPAFFLLAFNLMAFGQSSNHTCGAGNIHNPAINYGQATDIDGNSYKTVIIDSKAWFAENLKVTRFQNGDFIPNVSDSAAWRELTGPGMCSYKNDANFDCLRGKLYNFFVANDVRNPCPLGWRVPTLTDLYQLIFYLDPNANPQQPGNWPNTAGGALKSSGLTYWRAPNNNATNLSGFSAIPNGGRNDAGVFSFSHDAAASYWLSTQVGPGMGFFLELAYPTGNAVRNAYWDNYGICIRCVTDLSTLGIEDNETTKVEVFPNPMDDVVHLKVRPFTVGASYIISDLTGKVLLKGNISSEQTTISMVDFPSGMYFISFPSMNMESFKIIKI